MINHWAVSLHPIDNDSDSQLLYQGWNMFQREKLEGMQLNSTEWQRHVKALSREWKALSAESRDHYKAQASYEQSLRDESRLQPLPSRSSMEANQVRMGDAAFDGVSLLKKKTFKKISCDRLHATYAEYASSAEWQLWNGGLSNATGCLRTELIDEKTPAQEVQGKWTDIVERDLDETNFWSAAPGDIHHTVCHASCGHCLKDPHTTAAQHGVRSLHHLVSNGFLARLLQS